MRKKITPIGAPISIKARKKGTSEPLKSAVLVTGYFTDGSDAVRFRRIREL